MATYVLVHGAWLGGWCYRETAQALRNAGHQVFTPTLTGNGERAHLQRRDISLETHILDICGCLVSEELVAADEVILAGHGYGGMVITGVADRMPQRVSALAYIDAFVPQHWQSVDGLLRAASASGALAPFDARRLSGCNSGRRWLPPPRAEDFGVAPHRRAWVDRRSTQQARATFDMPILLTGAAGDIARRGYLLAAGWANNPFAGVARSLASAPGWQVDTVDGGHLVMVDRPAELAAWLLRFRGYSLSRT